MPFGFERFEARAQLGHVPGSLGQGEQPIHLSTDLGEPALGVARAGVQALAERGRRLLHRVGNVVRLEDLRLDRAEDPRLEIALAGLNRVPAFTGHTIAPPTTRPAVAVAHVETSPAIAALDEPGQQPSRSPSPADLGDSPEQPTATVTDASRGPTSRLDPGLHGLPEILGHDPPRLVVLPQPIGLWPFDPAALPGFVILDELRLVPDVLAAIDRVPDHLANRGERP